ncbi:MAG TPA: glyoxalase [Mycobacteriales bacterium]|nr:glyoxalase [Mycobacteriales bacterium]
MAGITSVTVETDDPDSADAFYRKAFGLGSVIGVRASEAATSGYRGFTLSIVVTQPSTVDSFVESAVDAGATVVKPAKKSFWGYGGVVQTPDGTIWKIASSAKKDTGPVTREIESIVLLLGVSDVKASKQFYLDHGLTVAKGFGSKYVEFAMDAAKVKLALYNRRAAAKDAGVPADGSGSHRLVIGGDVGPFTDPDGFAWESAA